MSTHAADDRGHVGDDTGGGGDEVGRQMRPGGVPTGTVEGDLQPVAGRGDRTGLEPDPPGVDPRVAVHGEDLADALQHPALDGVGGTAGQHLLGGLEEQPHGPRQQSPLLEVGEDEPRTQHHGRVNVVSARVCPVGHGRPVRALGLHVRDGQAVDVGAQGEHGPLAVPLPDVTDEAGPDGEHARLQPGLLQPLLDRRGGAELLVAELRVHVQVTPEQHEFGVQFVAQRTGKRGFPGKIDLGLW